MSLFDLDDPPVAISFRDSLEPSDFFHGDDNNAPEDVDGESLAWEGELIDGYPIEDETMADILEKKRKKNKKAQLELQVGRELPHVRASSPDVALYVARLRAARVMRLASSELHDLYYDGRVPNGVERLSSLGFNKEARYALSARPARMVTAGRRVTIAQDESASSFPEEPAQETMAPPPAAPQAEPAGDQESFTTEGRRGRPFGRAAALVRDSEHLAFVDALCAGLESKHADAASFMVGDRVKPKGVQDSTEDAMVSNVGSDGEVTVQQVDGGDPVVYKGKSSDKLQRTAVKTANVPAEKATGPQTHMPKGVHKAGDEKDHGKDDERDPWIRPEEALIVGVRWPNLAKLSAALPKLAARDWLSSLDRAVARSGGAWATDSETFELEARFPTEDSARRFAHRLADEFYVLPESIEASVRQPKVGVMKMGLLRVDMARRVILPGGVVFALEASVQPQDFRTNEGVIVMDPMSQALAEGVVASVGPDLVIIVGSDGTQYEYSRGYLRRLTLAKVSLAHVDDTVLPLGTSVSIGKKEGVLAGWDLDRAVPQVRVRFADGPRWVPRAAVVATVRVSEI